MTCSPANFKSAAVLHPNSKGLAVGPKSEAQGLLPRPN